MKKNKDGIVFEGTVYLSEENHRRIPIYMRIIQVCVIYLGGYLFMTIFTKCFGLQLINSHLLSAIILTGTVIYLMLLYPAYNFIKLPIVFVIYGGIIYYKYEQIKNGFFLFENAIIKRASNYYGFPEFRFIADYSMADRDITLLLIMIIIPVLWIFSYSMIRGKLKIICYIVMLIPVVVSFAMGITPPEADFIAYILILLFLSISNGFAYAEHQLHNSFGRVQKSMIHRTNIRSASIFCLLSLLLFFITKQFVTIEKYNDYNDEIIEVKTKVQNAMMDLSIHNVSNKFADIRWNIRPGRIESSGGLSLGELGRVDQVVYDNTEHLHVTAPLKSVIEGIYLKGYIGSVYTGSSWKTHSRDIIKSYDNMMAKILQEEFEPAIGSAMMIDKLSIPFYVDLGRIDITYLKANKDYVYAPYFTLFGEKDGVDFEYDLAAISDKKMNIAAYDYSYNILNFLDLLTNDFTRSNISYNFKSEIYNEGFTLVIPTQYSDSEKNYREFVYETYTKLPEKGLDRLKHDFSREQIGLESENLYDAINYVKEYLNRSTRYSLSPGRLPKDKDFVEYFIYENKIGYCSHFASAGALMLRAMGYPARYIEGYAINSSDLEGTVAMTSYIGDQKAKVTVKDYNAHAWVEVYYDGFGWVPIEFTTGSGMRDLVDAIGNTRLFEQGIPEIGPAEIPTELSPTPTIIPEEADKPSPPASGQDEDIKGSSLLGEDDGKSPIGVRWYVGATLIIIISTGLILYLIYISKSRVEIVHESYSRRALRLYKRIEQLFILDNSLPKKVKSLEDSEEYVKEHFTLIPLEDFERCMDTVRKARFGKESITSREYMVVKSYYNTLWNRIYERLPWIKKVYLKATQQIWT